MAFLRPLQTIVAALAALICVSAHSQDASPAVLKDILALTQVALDAIPTGKADVWERALTDDAMIVDEFGRRQNKKELVASIRPFPAGMSGSIEIRDPQLRIYGDTAVLECEEYETEAVFGQNLVVRYLAMNTYVRRHGEWKIAAMMDVTLPTPPPLLEVRDLPLADYPGVYRYGPGRAFTVALEQSKLIYRARPEAHPVVLDAVARDVFMSGDDEKNLMIFRRDESGKIVELIERRKFNDLHLKREAARAG